VRHLELLSPARDEAAARAAILNGADAVYMGATAFGARGAAANDLPSIGRVVDLAHAYRARVYVTLNTILHEEELPAARRLARALHALGVDALVIQDMAMLKLDLPPIPLHASTQMHNHDLARVKYLDRLGFRRIVLARELSLDQIRAIRGEVAAELEYFVHGALCVSLSGQCYLSHHLTGRSANRGECAQPCRMRWDLVDAGGCTLERGRHLLSLKDLNLSDHIPDLIDAGISSFKIEGRLKAPTYVANVTRHYASLLDSVVARRDDLTRASSGEVIPAFDPDPARSFNRGFTTYFLTGRPAGLVNEITPKSTGKRVARVIDARGGAITVDPLEPIHNADGLCYTHDGELHGFLVNRVDGNRVWSNEPASPPPGTWLYRNHDHEFEKTIERKESARVIRVEIDIQATGRRLTLTAIDEDGTRASVQTDEELAPALRPGQPDQICRQVEKCGGTIFRCTRVTYTGEPLFARAALVNHYRRLLLQALVDAREAARVRPEQAPWRLDYPFPGPVDRRLNITNSHAARVYQSAGILFPPPGIEAHAAPPPIPGSYPLMRARYCILHERGLCLKENPVPRPRLPLYLVNPLGRFRLTFDCASCFMEIHPDLPGSPLGGKK
jgi:putative protease